MLRYVIVNRKHPICTSNYPTDIDRHMLRFMRRYDLTNCDGAVLAFHKKKLVGFFRYYHRKHGRWLYAGGTYVLSAYRGQGVAKKLWVRALKHAQPKSVDVGVVSRGGRKLVTALRKKFGRKIFWYVSESHS